MLVHPVDFVGMCMYRGFVPRGYRHICLPEYPEDEIKISETFKEIKNPMVIHPGKHWPSKTIPAQWWKEIVREVYLQGFTPVIVGKHVDENVGYVDFEIDPGEVPKYFDYRDRLSIKEFIWLAKNTPFLLSNDSAIIHAAAAGFAKIYYVASCKHPDFLEHYRYGLQGADMVNVGNDGAWNYLDCAPTKKEDVEVKDLPEGCEWDNILPEPAELAERIRRGILNKEM